jgi:hypothetical protein
MPRSGATHKRENERMNDLTHDNQPVELEGEHLDAVGGGATYYTLSTSSYIYRYPVYTTYPVYSYPSLSLYGSLFNYNELLATPYRPRLLNVVPKDLAELVAELDDEDADLQ